jgi:hypothetical protein
MKILDLQQQKLDGDVRIAATVVWEDGDNRDQEIYYEISDKYGTGFTKTADAFLIASAVPALAWGESRIAIDDPVCPMLVEGITTNLEWIRHWRKFDHPVPRIETKEKTDARKIPMTRTASFLSAGVDSLFTLYWNRINVPQNNHYSIKDVVSVEGISGSQYPPVEGTLEKIASDTGTTLISIKTNVRDLYPDGSFWEKNFHGAALASAAHILQGRVTQILLAATDQITQIVPWGSHPLLDNNWSSQVLRVLHHGERFSRFEKIRAITEWPTAMSNVQVCASRPRDALNCGKCEKCVRTQLALVALGRLSKCPAFKLQDIDPDQISDLRILDDHPLSYYVELLPYLEAQGRGDLSRATQNLLTNYKPWSEWRKAALKEIATNIPRGLPFILIDEDELGTDEYVGPSRRIPFLEKDGVYWGAPADDEAAIDELDEIQKKGIDFVVLAWPAFWWLDVYTQWADRLRNKSKIIFKNDRLIIFDFRIY